MSTSLVVKNPPPRSIERVEETLKKCTLEYRVAGKKWGNRLLNSYWVYKHNIEENVQIVKMRISDGDNDSYTYFDLFDLEKVKDITWHIAAGGYVQGKIKVMNEEGKRIPKNVYMHHIITDFESRGKGYQDESIDHNNGQPYDNRRINIYRATPEEQMQNTSGRFGCSFAIKKEPFQNIITKTDNEYIIYTREENDEYYYIENHPLQTEHFTINGLAILDRIESTKLLYINPFASSSEKEIYPISKKLDEITNKINLLNTIYENWKLTNSEDKNIILKETADINEILNVVGVKLGKHIYVYNDKFEFLGKYHSFASAAKVYGTTPGGINRKLKDQYDKNMYKLLSGRYYSETKIYIDDFGNPSKPTKISE